ncbi:hypothetical protein F2Q68_00027573 [Brassica cretica]|uniref:Uncharacterized protein n=1 Tax=Brassica cretica TaxID=69181 RepID=A0A8S9I7B6_BRACR|nr:hypothetical protein F2Q68_00027573 [Brassica cretica]
MNDPKEHGKKNGKDLLASVQVIGRYVEARLADRVLYADEILKYGFCLNVIKTSLCPLEALKNMQEEAVRDDDIYMVPTRHSIAYEDYLQCLALFLLISVLVNSEAFLIGSVVETIESLALETTKRRTWKEEWKGSSCFCASDWKLSLDIDNPALLCPLASYKLKYLAIVKSRAEHLFEVINWRDDVLRTFMRRCMYLRYVEARLADRVLYADEILKYGFCLNVIKTSLCPLEALKNMQEEAVRDDDIVFNGLPSTEPF